MDGFIYNDGGRAAAGFKGKTGDCVTRAISIATGKPYKEVYDALNELAKNERKGKRKRSVSSSRNGVYRCTYEKYLLSLGFTWVPTMQIGKGCKVHLNPAELPSGTLVISLSKHLTTMINGIIYDIYDPRERGNTIDQFGNVLPQAQRCVYGYYIKKEVAAC